MEVKIPTSALANKELELTPPATSTPDQVSFLKRLQPCWPSLGTNMSSSLAESSEFESLIPSTSQIAHLSSYRAARGKLCLQIHQALSSAPHRSVNHHDINCNPEAFILP